MFICLGQTLRARRTVSAVRSALYDFTAAVPPSDVTYTHAANLQTYRDASYHWQVAGANAIPFDYDSAGNCLGMRRDVVRTNKANHANFAPVDVGGIAVISGDGAASIVADAANLAGATIDGATFTDLQNGNAIQLTGGTTGTTFQISLQAGNTNPHSWRACIATTATGYHGNIKQSDGSGIVNVNHDAADAYIEYSVENVAPNNSIRYLAIYVAAGKTVKFIGAQYEEGGFLTYPVPTTDSAGKTRTLATCSVSNLNLKSYFNVGEGAILGEFVFDHMTGFAQQVGMIALEGTGLTNALGMYINSSAAQARARDIIASANNQNNDVHKPVEGRRFPMAISWKDGESWAVAGPMRYNLVERAGGPTGIDRLYIGSRPFGDAMSGWVRTVRVYSKFRTLSQLGADMFPGSGTYKAVVSAGQSNKHGFFRSQSENLNSGEIEALAQMDAYWPDSENWLINAAMNGSFALKENDGAGDNWWYDDDTDTYGPRMEMFENIVSAFGVSRIEAIDWDQGESDALSSEAVLQNAYEHIFDRLRTLAGGGKPIVITNIGRRSDTENSGYNNVRKAYRTIVGANAWAHFAPEKTHRTLVDSVHLTDAAYGLHSTVLLRKIMSVLGETLSGPVDGPAISGAVRTGTSVAVSLSHPSGITDFVPTTGIEGFRFYDDATQIAITGAVRSDATTITLTLASTPSGAETLYYGYGTLYGVDPANLVLGDDANALPLQTVKVTL